MAINQVLKSTDGGVTWSPLTVTTHYTVSTVDNTITFVTAPLATDLIVITYQAYNNNLSPIANSRVIGGSAGVSDVYATGMLWVARLWSCLINKVPQADIQNQTDWQTLHSGNFQFSGELNPYSGTQKSPEHNTLNIAGTTSPAVKTFSYLTQSTRAKQCYVFKEVKYDADWGDDNKFNIVDTVSTTTDDNGNTILIGQKARLIDGRIKE